MPYTATATLPEPSPEAIQALPGRVLLEFGTDWCPHCLGAQPALRTALQDQTAVRHIKLEDGPGRRLGRTFRVKLWPTLVLLQEGQEIARLVRPTEAAAVAQLLTASA